MYKTTSFLDSFIGGSRSSNKMISRDENNKGFVSSSGFGFGSMSPSSFGGFGGGAAAAAGENSRKNINAQITRGRLRGGNSRRRFPKQDSTSMSDVDTFKMPEMPKMFGGGGDEGSSDPFKEMAAG